MLAITGESTYSARRQTAVTAITVDRPVPTLTKPFVR
jgi:hypothetical protein